MYNDNCILTINGGSSSIKFSLYRIKEPLEQLFNGEIENIGSKKATLNINSATNQQKNSFDIEAPDRDQAANHLIDWLEKQEHFDSVKAIGHRIVHGMKHTKPELVTDDLLHELKNNTMVENTGDSVLIVTIPIMGFNNRLGTLFIKYAIQLPALKQTNK